MTHMEHLEAITTYLAPTEQEALFHYVDKAEKAKVQHFSWDQTKVTLYIPDGTSEPLDARFKNLQEHHATIEALATLRFMDFRPVGDNMAVDRRIQLTLLPAAFYRVHYERMNRLKQWIQLTGLRSKEWMAVVAFLLSVSLAAIQIYNAIRGVFQITTIR